MAANSKDIRREERESPPIPTSHSPDLKAQKLLTQQWQKQLAYKAKEFEELRAKLALPRDMETLKLSMEEEIGRKWEERLYALDQEIDTLRQQVRSTTEENGTLKHQLINITAKTTRDLHAQAQAHADIHALTTRKVETLQKMLEDAETPKKVRSLKTELSDNKIRLRSAVDDLVETQNLLAAARSRLHNDSGSWTREIDELREELRNVSSEKGTQQHMISTLQYQITQLTEELAAVSRHATESNKELIIYKDKMDELVHTHTVKTSDAATNHLKEMHNSENRFNDLKSEYQRQGIELASVTETIASLREKLAHTEKEYITKLRICKEEQRDQVNKADEIQRELRESRNTLEKEYEVSTEQLEKVNTERTDLERRYQELLAEARKQKSILKAKIQRQADEIARLNQKTQRLEEIQKQVEEYEWRENRRKEAEQSKKLAFQDYILGGDEAPRKVLRGWNKDMDYDSPRKKKLPLQSLLRKMRVSPSDKQSNLESEEASWADLDQFGQGQDIVSTREIIDKAKIELQLESSEALNPEIDRPSPLTETNQSATNLDSISPIGVK